MAVSSIFFIFRVWYFVVGLFRAAIAQSGSSLSPWAYQREYKNIAYELASTLDANFKVSSDSKELLAFLRGKPALDINTVAANFKVSN